MILMISHYRNMDVYNLWQRMIGFESFSWKISSTWNPYLVTFKIWDMDVVYINELLEIRRSHGLNYFGKDKKIKKLIFFFFFFPEKNLHTK